MKRLSRILIAATCLLLLCQSGQAAQRYITVGTWGGTFLEAQREAFFKPFTKATGIAVREVVLSGDVIAKIKAQVIQNVPEHDLVCGLGTIDMVPILANGGYLAAIDYSKIPNAKDVLPEAKLKYGIGAYVLSNNIAYNKKYYPKGGPRNMAEFFDTKRFPGPRAFMGFSPTGYLESALIADGVPVSELYPLDVERAFRKLDELKPSIGLFWDSGAQQMQALVDEEVHSGMFWVGRAYGATEAGTPVEVVWKDGHLIIDCWVVPKTVRDMDAVCQFLDFCLRPEQEVIFSRAMKYGPVNSRTIGAFSPEERKCINTSPENLKQQFFVNTEYWTEHFEELTERYLSWISGGK